MSGLGKSRRRLGGSHFGVLVCCLSAVLGLRFWTSGVRGGVDFEMSVAQPAKKNSVYKESHASAPLPHMTSRLRRYAGLGFRHSNPWVFPRKKWAIQLHIRVPYYSLIGFLF